MDKENHNTPITLRIYFDFKKEKEKLRRLINMHLINHCDVNNEIPESHFKFENKENLNFASLFMKIIKDIAYEDMMNEKPLNFSQNIKETKFLSILNKIMRCEKIERNIIAFIKEQKAFEIKNEKFVEIVDDMEFFKILLEYKKQNKQGIDEEIIYDKIILITKNFNNFLNGTIDKSLEEVNLCQINFIALFSEVLLKIILANKEKTCYFNNALLDLMLFVEKTNFLHKIYFFIRETTIFSQDSIHAMKQKQISQIFGNFINILFGAIIFEKNGLQKNCLFILILKKFANFLCFTMIKSSKKRKFQTKSKLKHLIKVILQKLFEIQDDCFVILAKNLVQKSEFFCELMRNLKNYEIVENIFEILNNNDDTGLSLLQENYDFLETFLNCVNILIIQKNILKNKSGMNEFLEAAFRKLQANPKIFSFNIKPLLFKLELYLN